MKSSSFEHDFFTWGSMGLLKVEGKDSRDFLHRLSTQDFSDFGDARSLVSTVFPTNHGKIVDWTWVVHGQGSLWIPTTSERVGRLKEWLEKFIIMEDVVLEDHSDLVRACVVQSKEAHSFLGVDVEFGQVNARYGGYFSRGLEAYGNRLEGWVTVEQEHELKAHLEQRGLVEASLEQMEACRLRAGVPSPLWEYAKEVSPLELRLNRDAIAWNKGCYIGQEVISRLDSYDKVKRLLMGFSTQALLPAGEVIRIKKDGKTLGKVSSFVQLDSGETIGLGVVEVHSIETKEVELDVGSQIIGAAVLDDRPFWQS